MKIYETNAALGYNQLAYLIRLDKSKFGYNYLCIATKNVHDDDNYYPGKVIEDLEYFSNLEISDYDIKESPLYNDFLFDYFLNNYPFEQETVKEEKDIPINWYQIRTKCDWLDYCDVTGTNEYARNESWDPKDNEIIYLTKTQAEKLHLI
jgi:hypothetical protein